MANEFRKVTDQNGVDHPVCDEVARSASVTLLDDTVGWVGGNLYNLVATSKTDQYGGVWTVNADNTITVSGTPTAYAPFTTRSYNVLPVGNYIFTFNEDNLVNVGLDTARLYNGGTQVRDLPTQGSSKAFTFSINANDNYDEIRIAFKRITNDVAMSGVIKPMILTEEQYALSPTYRPYHESVEEYAFPRSEQAVVGVKNLWPKYVGSSATPQNVTFAADGDGVVSCEGTSSAIATWRQGNLTLKAGKYKLYGGEGIGTYNSSSYNALVGLYNPSSSAYFAPDEGTVDTYTFATDIVVQPTLKIQTGVDSSNYTFKPMIYFADDPDSTFVPYAMTNRELTEKKLDKTSTMLSSTDDLDNIKTAGFYCWESSVPTNAPEALTYGTMIVNVNKEGVNSVVHQIVVKGGVIYQRIFSGSPLAWKSWYKFEGTVVS